VITLVSRPATGGVEFAELDDQGRATAPAVLVRDEDWVDEVRRREAATAPRWAWDDTPRWYPRLLAAGVEVARCLDLRLSHAVLRASTATRGSELHGAPRGPWDVAQSRPVDDAALVVVEPESLPDPAGELVRQRTAVASSPRRAGLELLVTAESTGALVAAEMRHHGVPWSRRRHDELLTELLGPRPAVGHRPEAMLRELELVRAALDAPQLAVDSPADLLAALRRAGLPVQSTRQGELQQHDHPVVAPLLRYKKMQRLLVANGWSWLDEWVHDGRFRPEYVPGGVVTGRWASSGGGALQLPAAVRAAVVADPGHVLVVADVAQLEPRVLAGLAHDGAMAAAGAGDLYEGIVASGAVATRAEAKGAMLGAMYGATRGESGRLLPRLARAFPRAMALVDDAARAGERGESVTTLLGRSSPTRSDLGRGGLPAEVEGPPVGGDARSWGRFTRNFVVQGTAAEWALCWLGVLRRRLRARAAERPGPHGRPGAHLVFFLHDEVVVHAPADEAAAVVADLHAAADEAGRLLFGTGPLRFPLSVAVVDDYGQAKGATATVGT